MHSLKVHICIHGPEWVKKALVEITAGNIMEPECKPEADIKKLDKVQSKFSCVFFIILSNVYAHIFLSQ